MQLECTTMDGLFELMKKKNIVCWGIGNYFQAFVDSCNGKINLLLRFWLFPRIFSYYNLLKKILSNVSN